MTPPLRIRGGREGLRSRGVFMFAAFFSGLLFLLYVLGLLAGLVVVLYGKPGTWLIVALAFLYSLVGDFYHGKADFWILLPVILMAVFVECLDYLSTVVKRRDDTYNQKTVISLLIGGLIGMVILMFNALSFILVGLVLGMFAGGMAYEMYQKKPWRPAMYVVRDAAFSKPSLLFLKTIVTLTLVIFLLTNSL